MVIADSDPVADDFDGLLGFVGLGFHRVTFDSEHSLWGWNCYGVRHQAPCLLPLIRGRVLRNEFPDSERELQSQLPDPRFAAVALITPKVGEAKFVSGLANCGNAKDVAGIRISDGERGARLNCNQGGDDARPNTCYPKMGTCQN